MEYTPEEKNRILSLLQAFESYIGNNPYVDVFFSTKHGYLYVRYDQEVESAEFVFSADNLFERLMMDLSSDVRDLFLCGEHIEIDLYPEEIQETRNRLQPYLAGLPVALRNHYVVKAEEYFQHCNGGGNS